MWLSPRTRSSQRTIVGVRGESANAGCRPGASSAARSSAVRRKRGAIVDRGTAERLLALAAPLELVGGLVGGIEPALVR